MHLWPKIPGTANILNALLILFLPYSTSRSRGCHSVCLLEITSNVFIDRRWGWLYFPSSQQQIQCFISGRRWVIETLWAKWCSCCRRILRLLVFAWEATFYVLTLILGWNILNLFHAMILKYDGTVWNIPNPKMLNFRINSRTFISL